jgi:hypothetical protein
MPPDPREYYRVLELSPGASLDEIKRAYRQLLQRWHPDRYKPGSLMQTTAEDVTKELNEAYHQLCRKKRYLEFRPKPRPAPTRVSTGATREPWKPKVRHGWKVYEDVAAPPQAKPTPSPIPDASPPPSRQSSPPPAPPAPTKKSRPNARWPWRWIAGVGASAVLFFAAKRGLEALEFDSPRPRVFSSAAILGEAKDPVEAAPRIPVRASNWILRSAQDDRRIWSGTVDNLSLTANPPLRFDRARVELAKWESEPVLADDEAWSLVDTFAPGDTRARVIAVQGPPDEVGANLFRYGSSVVYFEADRVTHWSEGRPRLHVLVLPRFEFTGLATFGIGSSRADVIRVQGEPARFTARAFYYGASAVYFDREWVVDWLEVDRPLRAIRSVRR